MTNNRAFWKALHSLTHPLSIASILLLLFNDHWLRHNYPSWLTGKLGDFTWLLFAPFITAMLLAFLIPKDRKHQTKIVGLLSIGFIGIWFATAKTVPFVHWLTTETLYNIVGYRGTLRLDATDLLTLPALLVSWHIWRESAETNINLKPIGYVAFGLGIMTTIANSPLESDSLRYYELSYIRTICELNDGRLLIPSAYDGLLNESSPPSLISRDNGFNWQTYEYTISTENCSSPSNSIAIHPNNDDIQYRWVQGEYIEKSSDNGETWRRIHQLVELEQDVREYGNHAPYNGYDYDEIEHLQYPQSGIVHSITGNLILAMGSSGILVIQPDETSHWIAIEEARLDDLQNTILIDRALEFIQYLLPTLWCLIFVSTIVIIQATSLSKNVFRHFWVSIGWINWVWLVLTAHDSFSSGASFRLPTLQWGIIALLSLILIAIPMMLWAIYYLLEHYSDALSPIVTTAFLASLAYLLPLVLWTQGTIPRYYMASFFSLLLVGCVLWACYQQFKDKLPAKYVPEKAKRKQKEV